MIGGLDVFSRDGETEVPKEALLKPTTCPGDGSGCNKPVQVIQGRVGARALDSKALVLNPSCHLLSVGPGANYLTSLSKN